MPPRQSDAGDASFTVRLTASQLTQLDGIRGKVTRRQALFKLIADSLDKLYPAANAKPEDALKLLVLRPGGYPVPENQYPSVDELAPYVPFPFPPPPPAPGPGRTSYQEQRHEAWRAAWACYMENAGWPWPEIQKTLGYPSLRHAQQAASRHTVQFGEKAAADRRSEQRERIGRLRDWTWDHIAAPPFKFTVTGQVVRNPDGQPAVDEDIRIRYLDVALKIEERQARLDGSDARDALKIDEGRLDYTIKINAIVDMIKAGLDRPVIAGELEAGKDESSSS